jgi:hypothetical protein
MILVRDKQGPQGEVLNFAAGEWDTFIGGIRNGDYDRRRPPGDIL